MDNKTNKMQKNILLKDLTTFKIGGVAKYYCQASSQEEIIEAVKWVQEKGAPFFVLGGGSNVLIGDKKYKGLVIQIKNQILKIKNTDQNSKIIEVGAGVPLGKLVGVALQEGLTGMEWAMGIPGTAGGAVYGNTGAFGQSMGDIVEEVEAIDISNIKYQISNIKKEGCKFGYRDSIFKRSKNLIILSVKIKLQNGEKAEIENKMKEFFQKKKQTQPLEFFSAGSIFKNGENYKAADLIEKVGLKGKRIGGVEVSQKHSNFIVNNGRGKARDVKKLIDLIKKQVKKKFNMELQEEIQYLGF
ncbi:MAG: UDP-N-acetylmuramate dehydrogenase [Candidatus Pacebacteria bacterium]|nr:UDP-N-acetylmuramate dehydrogenase [Candidatus Paceibacterota bacterium]